MKSQQTLKSHQRIYSWYLAGLMAMLACLFMVSWAFAVPDFFDNRCASCHSDDTPTCNGCHEHHTPISASTDAMEYMPGSLVTVTLQGGQVSGWVRGLLYDQDNMEVDRAAGPTGTGDDGMGDPVTFPVTLQAAAPATPGMYTWEAAWYGSINAGGGVHVEDRTAVTVTVIEDTTPVPDEDPVEWPSTWGQIKTLFK